MIWEDVLAKFKELFGDEGEIGVYWYIWCGKKKR